MPYKKQKAIRSNKKDVIYDLMTDLGLFAVSAVLVVVSKAVEFVKSLWAMEEFCGVKFVGNCYEQQGR